MAWFFFGPKKAQRAGLEGGVQVLKVTVKGGYSPELVEVAAGVPVRLLFDRQESGDCSSRVVVPEFHVNQSLQCDASIAPRTLRRGCPSHAPTGTPLRPRLCGKLPKQLRRPRQGDNRVP